MTWAASPFRDDFKYWSFCAPPNASLLPIVTRNISWKGDQSSNFPLKLGRSIVGNLTWWADLLEHEVGAGLFTTGCNANWIWSNLVLIWIIFLLIVSDTSACISIAASSAQSPRTSSWVFSTLTSSLSRLLMYWLTSKMSNGSDSCLFTVVWIFKTRDLYAFLFRINLSILITHFSSKLTYFQVHLTHKIKSFPPCHSELAQVNGVGSDV